MFTNRHIEELNYVKLLIFYFIMNFTDVKKKKSAAMYSKKRKEGRQKKIMKA